MKLRYLLAFVETENTQVYTTDRRGHQTLIESDKWKEFMSNEVDSVCPRIIGKRSFLCILLRCDVKKFVTGKATL